MHDSGGPIWHYAVGGQQHGPVGRDELVGMIRAGRLTPDDLAWTDGMREWARIGDLPQLRPDADGRSPSASHAPPHEVRITAAAPPTSPAAVPNASGRPIVYVGFWLRFLAVIIDSVIISMVTFIAVFALAILLGVLLTATGSGGSSNFAGSAFGLIYVIFIYAISFLLPVIYQAWMEGSRLQATVGKLAIGAKVVDERGRRISYARSYGRSFGRLVSGMTMYVGFIMAAFTQRKQALHDMMAGTYVIRR